MTRKPAKRKTTEFVRLEDVVALIQRQTPEHITRDELEEMIRKLPRFRSIVVVPVS